MHKPSNCLNVFDAPNAGDLGGIFASPSASAGPAQLDMTNEVQSSTDTFLHRDAMKDVIERIDEEGRKTIAEAGNKMLMEFLVAPDSANARQAMYRAIENRLDRPKALVELFAIPSAQRILPNLTPPLFAQTPLGVTALVGPLINALSERMSDDEKTNEKLVLERQLEADPALAAQAKAVEHLARLGLGTEGDLFAYQWASIIILSRWMTETTQESAWRALASACQGAQKINLRVGFHATPLGPNTDLQRFPHPEFTRSGRSTIYQGDGTVLEEEKWSRDWSSVAQFDGSTWLKLRAALRGAEDSLRSFQLVWDDISYQDLGRPGAGAGQEMLTWLQSLPSLTQLDIFQGDPGCSERRWPSAASVMFSGKNLPLFPHLTQLRISHVVPEPLEDGLQLFADSGSRAFPKLQRLAIDTVGGPDANLSKFWSAMGNWIGQLESLTVNAVDLRGFGEAIDSFLSATCRVGHLIVQRPDELGDERPEFVTMLSEHRSLPLRTTWQT